MSKLRCILLDDELPGLTYLRMLCEQLPFVEVLRCYDSPLQLLDDLPKLDFDLCLLDINMPGLSGLEVAQMLKDKPVIFVSAHPEYAADAFDLEAVDFIKKPIVKERLEKALNKAYRMTGEPAERKEYFSWNTSRGKSVIFFDELLYITTSDVDKRDKLAYLKDDQMLLLKNITIEKLISTLPSSLFIQVNKGELISRKAVLSHVTDAITLRLKQASGAPFTVTLGDAFRKSFQEWIR